MADKVTEAEWKKSKRIEAERAKAVEDLTKEKPNQENLAYLDPQSTRVKGWSRDTNVILASVERIGNRAVVLAFAGVVLGIIGYAGGMVSGVFNLGMAGVLVSGLPSGVSFLCLGAAVLMAIITMGSEIFYKVKDKKKLSAAFWSAIGAVVVVVVYSVIQQLIIRFG